MKQQMQKLQVNLNQTEKIIRDLHIRRIYNDNFCMQDLKHVRKLKKQFGANLLLVGYKGLVL